MDYELKKLSRIFLLISLITVHTFFFIGSIVLYSLIVWQIVFGVNENILNLIGGFAGCAILFLISSLVLGEMD
jgi:uncharacterized membrane protein YdjX (TVP38/TMEM64 family)